MLNFRTFSTIFSMQVLGSVLRRGGEGRPQGEDRGALQFPGTTVSPLLCPPVPPGLRLPLGAQHGPSASQPACHIVPAHLADLQAAALSFGVGEHPTTPL